MRNGGRRHQVAVQRIVQMGVDRLNAPIMVPQTWVEPMVELEVRRGKEQWDPGSRQRYSEEVYRFRGAYTDFIGVDNTMKVFHNGQTFDIKAILPDEQHNSDVVIECTLVDGRLRAKVLMGFLKKSPRQGVVGQVYAGFSVDAEGGTAPYVFSVDAGPLPAGLAINAASGVVAGTPSAAGTRSVVFRVSDAAGGSHVLPAIDITIAA